MKVLKGLAKLAVFTLGVALLAGIGFEVSVHQEPLSPFWPLSGFVLAALLVRPKRDWPWLIGASGLGTAFADAYRFDEIHPYVIVPMLEPLIGGLLIRRFAGSDRSPLTLAYWVRSMLFGPVVSAGIGGALGAAMLVPHHPTYEFISLMRAWWFSDALGQIVVAPAFIALLDHRMRAESKRMFETQSIELATFAALFVPFAGIVFSAPPDPSGRLYHLHYALTPLLIWAALRFPAWVSFNGLAFYAGFSAWQMSLGHGPFVGEGQGNLARALAYQVPTLMAAVGVQMVQVLASERRTSSVILARSESRFRGIVESTNEWIWEVDADRRFVYSSPHSIPLLGYSPDELIGTDAMNLVLPEDLPIVEDAFERNVSRGVPVQSVIHRDRRKEGRIVHLEANVAPIFDAKGRLAGCRGVVRDVTERIAAEEAAKIALAAKAQSDKLIALGTVVSGVAHEINNPNQFITLNMPILRQAWADIAPAIDAYSVGRPDWQVAGLGPAEAKAEIAEAMEEVTEGSDRIRAIVSELREFLRGEPRHESEPFDLGVCVRAAVNLVSASIAGRSIRIELELASDLPAVVGQQRRIEQILINFVLNASEAMDGKPGTLTLRTSACEGSRFVQVEVIDDGGGIAPADLARVMDPFFTTKRDLGGMGLGLAISSRIAEEHGGRIELHSELGTGTTARLILPGSVEIGRDRPLSSAA